MLKKITLLASVSVLSAGAAFAQQIHNDSTDPSNTSTFSVSTATGSVAVVYQYGTSSKAAVSQKGAAGLTDMGLLSVMNQFGTSNIFSHTQFATENENFLLFGNQAFTIANGNNNSATVTQIGIGLISDISQGARHPQFHEDGLQADRNVAIVQQIGSKAVSSILQYSASTLSAAQKPLASDNRATVTQKDGPHSNAITQTSRGNVAIVSQYDGLQEFAPNAGNKSTVTQTYSGATSTNNPLSGNKADVAQTGVFNKSMVYQNGLRNFAEVSMLRSSNSSSINQVGNDLVAMVSQGSKDPNWGASNQVKIDQISGNRHKALVWNRGNAENVFITQKFSALQPMNAYSDGEFARSIADVSQMAYASTANITQDGDNFAEITQGWGQYSTTTIQQVDAGDYTTANVPQGRTSLRGRNVALVAQYNAGLGQGQKNAVSVGQNAIGASASVWQQVGSIGNVAHVGQGILSGTGGANTRTVSAEVTQGGKYNWAEVSQNGTNLQAIILQFGVGSPTSVSVIGGSELNRAQIVQSGTSQYAKITQSSGVGLINGGNIPMASINQQNSDNSATIDQSGKAQQAYIVQTGIGGIASIVQGPNAANAEAHILQSGTNNSYSVTQTVAGQYIYVTQAGIGNGATSVVSTRPGT